MDQNMYDIKYETSKSGHIVPVVNGVHLHSIYDPIKEAQKFARGQQELFKKNNQLMILGLGRGYHVTAVLKEMLEIYKNIEIVVIEPSNEVHNHFIHEQIYDQSSITIYSGSIKSIFFNKSFINFLASKPSILQHKPSFDLHIKYFTNFLKFRAPKELKDIISSLESTEMQNKLRQFPEYLSLKDACTNSKHKKSVMDLNDQKLLAFNELAYETFRG